MKRTLVSWLAVVLMSTASFGATYSNSFEYDDWDAAVADGWSLAAEPNEPTAGFVTSLPTGNVPTDGDKALELAPPIEGGIRKTVFDDNIQEYVISLDWYVANPNSTEAGGTSRGHHSYFEIRNAEGSSAIRFIAHGFDTTREIEPGVFQDNARALSLRYFGGDSYGPYDHDSYQANGNVDIIEARYFQDGWNTLEVYASPHPELEGDWLRYYLNGAFVGESNANWFGWNASLSDIQFGWTNEGENTAYFDNFSITTPTTAVPGDFDGDGDVDGADFVVWQTNFPTQTGATLATGDADGDGDVDGADFVIWQTNFPFTPSSGVAAVPEPGAIVLGGFAALALAVLRRRKRSRRNLAYTAGTLAFLMAAWMALSSVTIAADRTSTRPNILFIFTDDHAAQAVSAYGSKINRTPNIDRLAQEGMRFDNCFCTNSLCGPSRAVILTGKHSHLNGVLRNERQPFDGSQQTFPKLLQNAGYQTAMIGKWHLGSEPMGFDHWTVLPGQGAYYNPDFLTPTGRVRKEGYVTDIITDMTLEWLQDQRDPGKPFFLMYQHKAPHRQWAPGPEHLTLYQDEKIPEPPTLFDDYATRSKAARMQTMSIAKDLQLSSDLKVSPEAAQGNQNLGTKAWNNARKRLNDEQLRQWDKAYEADNAAFANEKPQGDDLVRWKYQRYIKDYLRTIASIDDNLGRVLDYLDQSGLADNTVVVYSSDQGFYLGEHGWFDKRFMYEESLRMPLIVRWPSVVKPGSTNSHLVQNLDFAQTFLELAGIEAPADMQGASLAPLLQGESPADWRDSIYYHFYESDGAHTVPKHYGVRTDRHKLIHFYEIDAWELYDLQEDPQELRNIYGDPAQQQVVDGLKQELRRLQARYDDRVD